MTITSQFLDMTLSSIFLTSLVNIITGFVIITIFFYKGLTGNLEIGNTPVWVLPNIWRLGRVMETKFGTKVFNKMLLNAAKCQGYTVYRFWVIKKKPTGEAGGGGELFPSPQIRIKYLLYMEKHTTAINSKYLS